MQQLDEAKSEANSSQTLKEFIEESKARLKAILEQLQWTEEDVEKSYNNNSAAAKVNQKEHSGSADEPTLPESCANWNSITLSAGELRKLVNDETAPIPQKFSDLQLNFTREQKLQIYEHVCAHTEKCSEPEVTVPALDEGNLSFAEIVAQKKREKKKRRRYRRTKPTHIEEVRGVVELQMQALQQYLESKAMQARSQKCQKPVKDRRDRSRDSRRHGVHKRRSRSAEREKYCQRESISGSKEHRSERRKHKKRSRSRSRSYDKKKYRERNESRGRKKHKQRSRSRSRSRKRHERRSRSGNGSHKRYRGRSGSRTHSSRHDAENAYKKHSSHHSRRTTNAEKITKYMNDTKKS